ncbi:MAG: GntR family transcriptional regulator [Veillonella sp.]|nr:GntR family transcriptional regulator [Veillonella sp.]
MVEKGEYKFSRSEMIDRLPLSEQVYITLKEAILRGKVKPGVKLNEVAIAEQMSVSATPVREAFRKLAKDNLVVIKPWKGVTVKGYTAEEIVAMYQCREVMEGLGARLCAEHATEEQVAELEALCQQMHSISDPEERVAVNSHFHSLIAMFSRNERVMDYLADFREMVNRDMYNSSNDLGRTNLCDEEHDCIINAIKNHDGEAAEAFMREHIRNAFVFKKAHAELHGKDVSN